MLNTILQWAKSQSDKITFEPQNINLEEIIIEFVDNGIGIKKEILENMEKEIFTSTTIGTSGEKGTGFGLGIVIEFIKKCNGTYKRGKLGLAHRI